MQNDGNNGFNNQNGFHEQPGPGGYEYNPNDFNNGHNGFQNGQGGYGQPGGYGTGPEGNRIILESCYNLRRLAREALRGKWLMAAVAAFLVSVLVAVPSGIIDNLFGVTVPLDTIFQQYGITSQDVGYDLSEIIVKSSPLSALYTILVTGPLTFGLTAYFLILFRRGKENLSDLFSGFEFFGKTLGLFLWMMLWVILWALIPLAGPVLAIIAGFRYSMAFMIQVDNPATPVTECLRRSKFLMKGNKGKLFVLVLTFIGWYLLASLPGAFLGAIVGMTTTSFVVLQIVDIIASFATAFVTAYLTTAQMAFYDMLIGRIYGESYIPGRY